MTAYTVYILQYMYLFYILLMLDIIPLPRPTLNHLQKECTPNHFQKESAVIAGTRI